MAHVEKNYFWLKLHSQFFENLAVKALRRSPGGDTYLVIFFKLALKTLENGGKYELQGICENPVTEIAMDLDEDEQAVGEAMALLSKYKMVEVKDERILVPYVENNLGTLSSNAVRQARFRENRKAPKLPGGEQDPDQGPKEAQVPAGEPNEANTDLPTKKDGALQNNARVTPMSQNDNARVRDIYRVKDIYNNTDSDESDPVKGDDMDMSEQGENSSSEEETTLTQEAVDKVLAAWNNLHDKHPEMIAKASRIQYMGGTWLDLEKLVQAYGVSTVCEMIAYIDQTRPYRNVAYYAGQGRDFNKLKIAWFVSDTTGKRQDVIDDYYDAQEQAAKAAEAAAKEAAAREAEKQRMGMTQTPKKPAAPAEVKPAAKTEPARGSLFDLFK